MPAVPAIISGGAMLGSTLLGSKAGSSAARSAQARSPEELALMKSQTGLADQERDQGQQLFGTAMPAIRNTLNYYQTLLGGNRSARMAAVSPEAQDVAGAYEGANRAIGRGYVTGGERDTAVAENARAKAGQISRLVTGVRPGAANAMGSVGQGLLGSAQGFGGQAGSLYSNLLGNSTYNRMGANQIGMETSSGVSGSLGALIAQLLKSGAFGKQKVAAS